MGTACLLAHIREPGLLAAQDLRVVLEEEVGEVVCVARHRRGEALASYFTLPRLPQRAGEAPEALAERLGLRERDIGFGHHVPSVWSAGVAYILVPVATPEALSSADPRKSDWGADGGPAVYLYCPLEAGSRYRARAFASGFGILEDPATGSAAASFAGAAMSFDPPGDGDHMLLIEQGVEMGRPSLISLGLVVEGGALQSATIGGSAVIVSEGKLL